MKLLTERQMQQNYLLKDGDYKSTKEIFERIAKYVPDNPILAELDSNKNIVYHTSKDLLTDIEALGNGLLKQGLENKHIVISAQNSYRYIITDATISGGVGVVIPIDKDASLDLFVTLLTRCDADAIICSTAIIPKVEEAQKQCPKLQTIITIDGEVDGYMSWDKIREIGKNVTENTYRNKQLDLNAPAKILFTSGTTGFNKAVVLTQNNLSANIINCLDTIKARKNEVNTSMSVLPMHHATEINTHVMARIACGRLTYINDDMKNIMTNIKIFKPTCITVVPMIANMFYRGIWANAKKQGLENKLKKGIKLCNVLKKVNIDITHVLFKDLFANFGGNLSQIVCGGAMLNPEVVRGFKDLGVYIINGYGITECGPLVSMNVDTFNEPFSIGAPCPQLEAKVINIDENGVGELCIHGKSIASGYYNDDTSTQLVFDKDGFFHTGDLVKQGKNGKLFLSGRKKNVIILANGKNVCPEELENLLENKMPYCQDVVVYTIQKTINNITQEVICAGLYIEDKEIRNKRDSLVMIMRTINETLPMYKQIRVVNLADEPYQKTSTRKIKRDTILASHKKENEIYL